MTFIKELNKPLTYYCHVKLYMRRWKRGKHFYKSSLSNIFSVIWLATAITAIVTYAYPIGDYLSNEAVKNYNDFLITSIPTQAAVVGIIIPIIFALVEQLFKNQDTFFKAFLYWSKVIHLTISSLLLVLFLSIQIVLSIKITAATFWLSFSWFSLNLIGTIRLVLVSLSFFFPARRFALLLSYIGEILLPAEIRRNLDVAVKSTKDTKALCFQGFIQNLYDKIISNGTDNEKRDTPKTKEILHHLSIPALESIRNGAHEDFQDQLKFLIDAHTYLITRSGVSGNTNDNYATLSTSPFWGWGMAQFMDWNNPYRQIITECVAKIEIDSRFYETYCYYCIRGIYERIVDYSPQRITGNAVEWATMAHYVLMHHVFKQAISNLPTPPIPGEEITLPTHLKNTYISAIKTYISAWESLKQEITFHLVAKEQPIERKRFKDLDAHLKENAYSICRCVSNGDKWGALWLIDTHLRWNERLYRISQTNYWQKGSLEIFSRNFHDLIEAPESLIGEEQKIHAVIITYNLWFDTTLALYGLLWGHSDENDTSFPKEIASSLYHQRTIDNVSRTPGLYGQLSDGFDLLCSFIRIKSSRQYEASITEKLGRGFNNPFDSSKISGRVYVSGGGNYIYETFSNLILSYAYKVQERQFLLSHRIDGLLPELSKNADQAHNVSTSLQMLIGTIERQSTEKIKDIYLFNHNKEISAAQAKYYKRTIIIHIKSIKDRINNRYIKVLKETPISQRLIEIERGRAEVRIFQEIQHKFPVSLFTTCHSVNTINPLEMMINARIGGCPKEIFVEHQACIKTMPDGSLDSYTDTCLNEILKLPLSLALQKLGKENYTPRTPLDFWKNFKAAVNEVKQNGYTPIILDSTTYLDFLNSWEHNIGDQVGIKPIDFGHNFQQIFQEKYGENYRKHLYNEPVFAWRSADTNCFIILGKEQLKEAMYRKYADNTHLSLHYQLDNEENSEGIVEYKCEYDVSVIGTRAHYINVEALQETDY
ncbi:hypothetical protein [Micavibrio aeruginosavorus]|uniref:Uncharacterized protein n=1 Tax=Micavibrio aeruginosavorus (strain ARL-13) TaxID=856793 RepID=G2KQ14_MICAA|nr:hypothetical protein [Micavibrio aeruginosavorus]AEP10382.1 hypothetical protein MICA_2075 [Micavibrio aeruginosavorus ARL-13]